MSHTTIPTTTLDDYNEKLSSTHTKVIHSFESYTATNVVKKSVSGETDKTNFETIEVKIDVSEPAPIERIYPHIFDENDEAGQTVVNIKIALSDAKLALESYSEADIASINSRLTLIATTMSSTHNLTKFNESLGAVVSYIRRATLNTSMDEINLPSLNALVHVLLTISKNPMINLNDAGDLIDKLSDEGWKGEHGFSDKLLAAFLDDLEADTILQAGLFDKVEN